MPEVIGSNPVLAAIILNLTAPDGIRETMNPIIQNAIRTLSVEIPRDSIHIYYDKEDEARRESFRTGQPFFVSVINGVKMYSVRAKI